MIKILFLSASLFVSLAINAQGHKDLPSSEHASGSISIPALLSMDVSIAAQQDIKFASWADFTSEKILYGFFTVDVKATMPWVISVMSSSPYFTSTEAGSGSMPVGLFRLKSTVANAFLPLSIVAQPVLINSGNEVDSRHSIDVKVDPPWNYRGGQYSLNVMFSITPR